MLLPAEFYFKAATLEPDAAHYDNPDYFTGYMKAIRDIMKLIDEMEDKRLDQMALKFGDE